MRRQDCDVLFVAANARSLCANRGDLIADMKARGLVVAAAVPDIDYLDEVESLGIQVDRFPLRRAGLNPLFDLHSIRALVRIITRRAPRKIFAYGLKPVLYGIGASCLVGRADRYAMITGLGHLFTTKSGRNDVLRRVVESLYSACFSRCRRVFFQNPDDAAQLGHLGGLADGSKAVIVNGSGINLDRFAFEPPTEGPPTFVFIGRLLHEKGVVEFVEAAKQVKATHPQARFIAVGPFDSTLPHAVAADQLEAWIESGDVQFVGGVADVRPWIRASTALVLPSYREGTPKAVLEAMAMGRAIVTTDAPGCRETTLDGVNGYLVPVRDVPALAVAIRDLAADPERAKKMGLESRRIAEHKYDVRVVNAEILRQMEVAA